jgi:hypothetical protein
MRSVSQTMRMIMDAGYLIDQRLSHFIPPGSMPRRILRSIHLTYVLRDISLLWFFKPADITQVLSRGEIPRSYDHLKQFKEAAGKAGISYVIVLLPRNQMNPWGALKEQMTADRIAYVDLSFLSNEFTDEQYMASRFDPHPSSAVHRRIGQTLAAYVQDNLW